MFARSGERSRTMKTIDEIAEARTALYEVLATAMDEVLPMVQSPARAGHGEVIAERCRRISQLAEAAHTL